MDTKTQADWEWKIPCNIAIANNYEIYKGMERIVSSFSRVVREGGKVIGQSESGRRVTLSVEDREIVVRVDGLHKSASESWFIHDLQELLEWVKDGSKGYKPNGSLMGFLL